MRAARNVLPFTFGTAHRACTVGRGCGCGAGGGGGGGAGGGGAGAGGAGAGAGAGGGGAGAGGGGDGGGACWTVTDTAATFDIAPDPSVALKVNPSLPL
jgi:hypothetical protein